MKRTRRTFVRDYKLAAVKKVVERGLSYAEVARDLGIRETLIHNWRNAFEADGTLEAEVNQIPSVEAELKRLREENRQLKMERDILKKATTASLPKKTVKTRVSSKKIENAGRSMFFAVSWKSLAQLSTSGLAASHRQLRRNRS